MVVNRYALGSSLVLVAACSGNAVLGERELDAGPDQSGGTSGRAGGGAGGSAGTAASSGLAGSPPCQPTAEICYGNRPPSSPGSECLATIDNSPGGTLARRVQLRQTWNRSTAPIGNTSETVYGVLRTRTQLNLAACHMPAGTGGYIQLTDWDRSDPIITNQTVRTGYASYSSNPALGAPTGASVVSDGLCFIEWDYACNQTSGCATLPEVPASALSRWPQAQPQPWHVAPVTSKRIAADFDAKDGAFRQAIPPGEGRVFIDEAKGYMHSYTPLAYVTFLDSRAGGLAMPLREAEVRSQFNDPTFNCLGRFRADKLDAPGCDTLNVQTNPQWGCKDDAACPPPGFEDLAGSKGPGAAPSITRGYFLIVDLERVWSITLGSTLCVSYPSVPKAEADGWAKPASLGGWGLNCRGSSKWDPSLPDDAGLPMGDWCSKTNSPATITCHDAYLSESFSTSQAFKVKAGTCNLGGS